MKPRHPGTVTFVDETAGTQTVEPASSVPETIAWAKKGGVDVPVVRVVAVTMGDRRTLNSYGQDGTLLSTTVQVRPPTR